jgi:hypothetical protein
MARWFHSTAPFFVGFFLVWTREIRWKSGVIFYKWIMVVALGGFSFSCDGGKVPSALPSSGYSSEKAGHYSENEFSEWMSKADVQMAYEKRAEGTFFVYAEGRSNGGCHQYRYVSQPFPNEEFSEWASYWGMTPDEFYRIDVKMQRTGFKRANLQVFEDKAGNAYYQSLWMKPRSSAVLVSPKLQQSVEGR